MTLFRVALTDDLDGAQPILKVTTISTASIEPKQVGFLGDLGVMMAGFKSSLHFLQFISAVVQAVEQHLARRNC